MQGVAAKNDASDDLSRARASVTGCHAFLLTRLQLDFGVRLHPRIAKVR
jgi:hypothetical protein